MTRHLSTYGISHRPPRKVDYYETADREVWILHDAGCQPAMTPYGLCLCPDPQAFEIELVSRRGMVTLPMRR